MFCRFTRGTCPSVSRLCSESIANREEGLSVPPPSNPARERSVLFPCRGRNLTAEEPYDSTEQSSCQISFSFVVTLDLDALEYKEQPLLDVGLR